MKHVSNLTNRWSIQDSLSKCSYKKTIDIPYAIEIISEIYGDVLPLLDNGSLIYGGIIRDIIAGMFPLSGDLDIVTLNARTMVKKFESCNKITYKSHTLHDKKYIRKTFVKAVTNFETYDGNRIQIINPAGSICDLVTSTDFVCCGIVMTNDGTVFEVVRGAEEACRNHMLTINNDGDIIYKNIKGRIEKLVNRGWKSKINMLKVKKLDKKRCTKNNLSTMLE